MAMDFFDHQERARRRAGRLVGLFVLAVIAIILSVYAVTLLLFGVTSDPRDGGAGLSWWNPQVFAMAAGGTLLVVGLGSLFKVAELSKGGSAVADMLGGRRLELDQADPDERRVLNVVEEMALAAGAAVPPVYMLDNEEGINAFAAGYSPGDAVIGVTRGCVTQLTRDELQGVIAHEFSHILNGDMRLNIRLIGLVHGILIISLIGWGIVRSLMYAPRVRTSRRGNKEGGGIIAIVAFGAALIVIGYIGMLFGQLIKAAVSRQREFLADASAVQYTRNPDGIAGALAAIGGLSAGSSLQNSAGQQISHMLFSTGFSGFLNSLFATHPPLPERIARINPGFVRKPPPPRPATEPSADAPTRKRPSILGRRGPIGVPFAPDVSSQAGAQGFAPEAVMASVGQLSADNLQHAGQLVARMPQTLRLATDNPFSARAVVYCLLLADDPDIRQSQLAQLQTMADPPVYRETVRLAPTAFEIDHDLRLPLLDRALPSLRQLTAEQDERFRRCLDALVEADGRTDPWEWALRRVVHRHLDDAQGHRPRRVGPTTKEQLQQHCRVLLSYLAHRGQTDSARAYAAGASAINLESTALLPESEAGVARLDAAVETLVWLKPRDKRRVIDALVRCVLADEQVTLDEAEVLRAICDALGAPVPPLLRS